MTKTYCQYRRLRSGDWGIMGPADVVKPDAQVIVKKKDGSTKIETVEALVGKPFDVDGVPHQFATVWPTHKESGGRWVGDVGKAGGRRNNGRCRAPGCRNSATENAPHQQAWDGYCGWCAFDEM